MPLVQGEARYMEWKWFKQQPMRVWLHAVDRGAVLVEWGANGFWPNFRVMQSEML